MLKVTMRDPVTTKGSDEGSEALGQLQQFGSVRQLFLNIRIESSALRPLHLQHGLPLAVHLNAARQEFKVHLPLPAKAREVVANGPIPFEEIRLWSVKTLNGVAAAATLEREYNAEVTRDRLGQAEGVRKRAPVPQVNILHGQRSVVNRLDILLA
jgi:hypothetical protein